MRTRRRFWQQPWGYPESIVSVLVIIVLTTLLQVLIGGFDFYLLLRPVNLVVLALLTMLSIFLGCFASHHPFAQWISGVPMSVVLVASFVLLTVLMGLTPQLQGDSQTCLGRDAMTRHWSFIWIYTLSLISLGTLIVRRLKAFRWRDTGFYLNHLGLWLFLMASGLGYADMERYVMHVQEGETQWRVYDAKGNVKELPLAIELHDFDIDYYPPKLAMIDNKTGEVLSLNEPDEQMLKTMPIDSQSSLVMTRPEPRVFISDIDVYTEKGTHQSARLEVNKPLRVGHWTVYQYGYDQQAGRLSTYSSFELVYDPWLYPVYVGMVMMMLGSALMIWQGKPKKNQPHDLA